MKVLLCQDVKPIGWVGDVVEVSNGYARNYLLPQHLAVVPSKNNLRALAKEKEEAAQLRLTQREQLEKVCQDVNGAEAVIAAKANVQGHLFGSVAPQEVADNLRKQGFDVSDEIVCLPEHIKQTGNYEVLLKFADEVSATINLIVVPEQEE